KVFDPFFTTKDMGKGTGLGLSTVYGVIRQMGGAVGLESSPENGATFQLFLPAVEEEIQTSQESAPAAADPQDLTGAGRILIVEDEDPVRAFVRAALTDCGYQVVEAEDGEDALDVIKDEDGEFDLIISDVMMPVMDGPTAIQHARADLNLESKVLFMSAYAEAAVQEQLSAIDDAAYIQKPFTLKGIAGKVKQLLYEPDGRQEAQ
ncbi:MAG: response regulator, partial [Pseudomonadota bacterium]